MDEWGEDELGTIGEAEEVQVATRRADGTSGPFVTIWAVRVGDELFVRSAYGADNPWYVRALGNAKGRLRVEGRELAVRFEEADDADHDVIDEAYRTKYGTHPPEVVATVVGPAAHGVTLAVLPTSD